MRLPRPAAWLLAVSLLASGIGVLPSTALAAGARLDSTAAAQLMALTNRDRAAHGLAALAVDPTLAALAANRSFTCPSRPALHPAGRALDMAARDYLGHGIAGCQKIAGVDYTVLDVLYRSFGYHTAMGENIGFNGYPSSAVAYAGLSVEMSVAGIESAFMASPDHRANILGHYNRFGCGAAISAAGLHYYTCIFSAGGPTIARPAAPAPRVSALSGLAARLGIARWGHDFGASFSDARGLRSATVALDGRVIASFALAGRSAQRTVSVWAWRLRPGRHTITWTVRNTAGRSASVSYRFAIL